MSKRYMVAVLDTAKGMCGEDMQDLLNQCPPTHRLHSIVSQDLTQHGTHYFYAIFVPKDE